MDALPVKVFGCQIVNTSFGGIKHRSDGLTQSKNIFFTWWYWWSPELFVAFYPSYSSSSVFLLFLVFFLLCFSMVSSDVKAKKKKKKLGFSIYQLSNMQISTISSSHFATFRYSSLIFVAFTSFSIYFFIAATPSPFANFCSICKFSVFQIGFKHH